jgi:hypothetical protein
MPTLADTRSGRIAAAEPGNSADVLASGEIDPCSDALRDETEEAAP